VLPNEIEGPISNVYYECHWILIVEIFQFFLCSFLDISFLNLLLMNLFSLFFLTLFIVGV
jgi:hypothetical protein